MNHLPWTGAIRGVLPLGVAMRLHATRTTWGAKQAR